MWDVFTFLPSPAPKVKIWHCCACWTSTRTYPLRVSVTFWPLGVCLWLRISQTRCDARTWPWPAGPFPAALRAPGRPQGPVCEVKKTKNKKQTNLRFAQSGATFHIKHRTQRHATSFLPASSGRRWPGWWRRWASCGWPHRCRRSLVCSLWNERRHEQKSKSLPLTALTIASLFLWEKKKLLP